MAQSSLNPPNPEPYQEQAQDLVFNENVLLQTLGFDVAVDHPHTHVVRTCHLVKGMGQDHIGDVSDKFNVVELFYHKCTYIYVLIFCFVLLKIKKKKKPILF